MDKEYSIKIDEIFDKKKKKDEEIANIRQENERKKNQKLEMFCKKRDELYEPLFQEFARKIKENGIDCEIKKQDERDLGNGAYQSPSIALYILIGKDNQYRDLSNYPHFQIYSHLHEDKISFHKSTFAPNRGGMSGFDGSYDIEDINSDLLSEKIVKLLGECLNG